MTWGGSYGDMALQSVSIVNLAPSGCSGPGSFTLSSPGNGDSFGSSTTTVTLQWGAAAGATGYDVYFGTTSPPPQAYANWSTTSYTASVAAGHTYYWSVVARNSCATLAASSGTWSFSVGSQPNLTPYQPAGWSAPIVVSTGTGTTTDSFLLRSTDTLYLDWAAINNGGASVPAAPNYYFDLYLDGSYWGQWYASVALDPNYYLYLTDFSLGSLAAGVHTLTLVCDSTGVVAESDENDNSYTKTILVTGAAKFYPVTPCRVVDTRTSVDPAAVKRGNFLDDEVRAYTLSDSTDCPGLPTDAKAWSLNVQLRPISVPAYLIAFPDGVAQPAVSTLVAFPDRWRVNNAIVPAGAGATFDVYCQYASRVVVDVNGYFK